jgi:hypothetical protein
MRQPQMYANMRRYTIQDLVKVVAFLVGPQE